MSISALSSAVASYVPTPVSPHPSVAPVDSDRDHDNSPSGAAPVTSGHVLDVSA